MKKKLAAIFLCLALAISGLTACGTGSTAEKPGLKKDPIAITVWHYYNGDQQQSFDRLVREFNETMGLKQGIIVTAHSYGKVQDLNQKVLDAVYEKVGAAEVPDVFASYADTAYEINQLGKVTDISQYLTPEEQAEFIPGYLSEGEFEGPDSFKIFPVAKATELVMLNKTQWDAFAAATGAAQAELATWEGISRLAEQYYNWTDGLTPDIPEDGKAFFGRDAFANYIIIGSYQLGAELFPVQDGKMQLNPDKAVLRRLWDNFYLPYINGYYAALGKFRTDDIRTGDLVACVGANSGATYFPPQVTRPDGSTYPIEGAAYPLPNFEGSKPVAVQQGAGMVVTKSTPERERAAVEFLKWFTKPEQNVRFAVASGYLPVTYEGSKPERVTQALEDVDRVAPVLRESLLTGVDMTQTYELYTSKAFKNGSAARAVVEKSMKEKAAADRLQVLDRMAAGSSRAQAVAEYATDENFDLWFASFTQALEQAVSK
ncbi:MAG: extracellular solute-binding protein [Pseudoflavonifractor sp.]